MRLAASASLLLASSLLAQATPLSDLNSTKTVSPDLLTAAHGHASSPDEAFFLVDFLKGLIGLKRGLALVGRAIDPAQQHMDVAPDEAFFRDFLQGFLGTFIPSIRRTLQPEPNPELESRTIGCNNRENVVPDEDHERFGKKQCAEGRRVRKSRSAHNCIRKELGAKYYMCVRNGIATCHKIQDAMAMGLEGGDCYK